MVSLTAAAFEALRRTNRAVLAAGHSLGRVRETRRRAARSVEEAQALTAQAEHQRRRAARNVASAHVGVGCRVLAVDDSEVFLRAAASVVSATSELRLVGRACSGEEAIRLLPDLNPDLVLLDLHMPGLSGIETTRIIKEDHPRTVVVLASAEPTGLAAAARSAGANAFLHKGDLRPGTLDRLWLEHRPADTRRG